MPGPESAVRRLSYNPGMAEELICYRCGASLESLSLPLSRQDECPSCTVYVHVCRMCKYYDPQVPKQCREDDAEEVIEKERVNFCEWFKPGTDVFDAQRYAKEQQAKNALSGLFGDGEEVKEGPDALLSDAKDLFR